MRLGKAGPRVRLPRLRHAPLQPAPGRSASAAPRASGLRFDRSPARQAHRAHRRGIAGEARGWGLRPAAAQRVDVRRGGAAASRDASRRSRRAGSLVSATRSSGAPSRCCTIEPARQWTLGRAREGSGELALDAGGALRPVHRPAADALSRALAHAAGLRASSPTARRRSPPSPRMWATTRKAAFSRAFKRIAGMAPATWRRLRGGARHEERRGSARSGTEAVGASALADAPRPRRPGRGPATSHRPRRRASRRGSRRPKSAFETSASHRPSGRSRRSS